MTRYRAFFVDCNDCGRQIHMRFMSGSNETWQPFDPSTDDRHDCTGTRRFMPVSPLAEYNAALSLQFRRLPATHYRPGGPVQRFVDTIGNDIVDMEAGSFRDTVVARAGFTMRFSGRSDGFVIDGGKQPAVIVDAGNAVVTFRGIAFRSSSPLGTIVVLSGGVRLEGCTVAGTSVGIRVAAATRTTRLHATSVRVGGPRSTGIVVAAGATVVVADVRVSGATRSPLDVDPAAEVEGMVNATGDRRSPETQVLVTPAPPAPTVPPPPPVVPSVHAGLVRSLAELTAEYQARADALLCAIRDLPAAEASPKSVDAVEGRLAATNLALYGVIDQVDGCIEHVGTARQAAER